ncbi:MAG: glycosyltransferase [Candidatus Omnitrophica bacterium]|nr:glycosyltransferase [Candidatus Omnitrophota bacterium]
MKTLKEKVSIIMPAFNEAGHIQHSIEETAQTFNDFGCPWELIVIDDSSSDNTYELALQLCEKYPDHLIVKKNSFHLGKGRAVKKALRYMNGEYVVFLDADMDLHPLQVQTLFDIMRLDNADVVIGSKLHPNSVVFYPWHRRIVSGIYYGIVKILFGLPCRDTQTGLKLFKAQVLRDVLPRILVKEFAFDIEVLANAHHLGYKIVDAPIEYKPRNSFGWIKPRAAFVTFRDTLAVFYRMYVLKYYDRIDYHRRKGMAKEFRRMRR